MYMLYIYNNELPYGSRLLLLAKKKKKKGFPTRQIHCSREVE